MNPFLQAFLYIDVFIIGVLFTLAYRHGRAHLADKQPATPKQRPTADSSPLPKEMRDKLLENSAQKFQLILDHSAEQLQQELKQTSDRINMTLRKLASDITTKELENYQAMFKQYQQQSSEDLSKGKQETDKYLTDLKTQLAQDLEKEKQQMVELIDSKVSDAVVSFLSETLQHEVDLGAQEKYLLDQLDAHKDELIQAVKSEA